MSFDTIEEQKTFADEEGFPYTLISDADKSIGDAYGMHRTPDMALYDMGVPRRVTLLISPDGKIAKVYDLDASGDDLNAHADQVLGDIKVAKG